MLKVKRTLQPYSENGKIYFGFGNSSLLREIEDNDYNRMVICSTNLEDDISKKELESLKKLGLLTDNQYDDSRFSRNINFFEWIDESTNTSPQIYQEKLLNSTVLIVGVGGIGGTVAESLARLGIGKLILVDFDIVDNSNLTRQTIYTMQSVGLSKIECAKKYLEKIGNTQVEILNRKIESEEDLERIYRERVFDFAVCSADNPDDIDLWFDDLAQKYNKPFIAGSYASTVINYACIIPGKTMDLRTFYAENQITDEHLIPEKLKSSIISPVAMMAAGLISYKVFAMLTGLNNECNCIQIDILTWEVQKYDIDKCATE